MQNDSRIQMSRQLWLIIDCRRLSLLSAHQNKHVHDSPHQQNALDINCIAAFPQHQTLSVFISVLTSVFTSAAFDPAALALSDWAVLCSELPFSVLLTFAAGSLDDSVFTAVTSASAVFFCFFSSFLSFLKGRFPPPPRPPPLPPLPPRPPRPPRPLPFLLRCARSCWDLRITRHFSISSSPE